MEGTELTDEILVSVMETVVQTNISKMKMDRNNNIVYALMEDGTMWGWNKNFRTPTQLPIENVKDFMSAGGQIYILDNEGIVRLYDINIAQYNVSTIQMTEDSSFAPMKNIVAMADQFNNGGSFFAIDKNGFAWAWGSSNGSGQLGVGNKDTIWPTPMMVAIDEPVVKIVSTSYETMFLTEDGNAYYAGENSAGTLMIPKLVCSGVEDIYVYSSEDAAMRTATDVRKYGYSTGTVDQFNLLHEDEFVHENKCYYIEDGRLYTRSGAYSNMVEAVDVPGTVVSVFYLAGRLFIETAEGDIFALGEGNAYVLGTGTETNAEAPVQLSFGAIENTDPIRLQAINGMSVAEDSIPYAFEVRAGEPLY